MVRLYVGQQRQNRLLQQYRLLIVHSAYVRREYLRQGIPESRIRVLHYPAWTEGEQLSLPPERSKRDARAARLLFLGRMEESKGGGLLIDALPLVAAAYRGKIEVVFAGEGSARDAWENRARRLKGSTAIEIRFSGWLEGENKRDALEWADALVVPSLWAEPFGLVGPEAGLMGVPAIAFDVGGISEWLSDGTNGFLASSRPPTPGGLAEAILKLLQEPARHETLRRNAWEAARRFSPEAHFTALDAILHDVAIG